MPHSPLIVPFEILWVGAVCFVLYQTRRSRTALIGSGSFFASMMAFMWVEFTYLQPFFLRMEVLLGLFAFTAVFVAVILGSERSMAPQSIEFKPKPKVFTPYADPDRIAWEGDEDLPLVEIPAAPRDEDQESDVIIIKIHGGKQP